LKWVKKYNERIIENPNNKISICMSLQNICKNAKSKNEITYFGSLFYYRQISGIRVIAKSDVIDFNGFFFKNYGSHCEDYKLLPYCSFAAGIGMTNTEVNNLTRLIINVFLFENNINFRLNHLKENLLKFVITLFHLMKKKLFL